MSYERKYFAQPSLECSWGESFKKKPPPRLKHEASASFVPLLLPRLCPAIKVGMTKWCKKLPSHFRITQFKIMVPIAPTNCGQAQALNKHRRHVACASQCSSAISCCLSMPLLLPNPKKKSKEPERARRLHHQMARSRETLQSLESGTWSALKEHDPQPYWSMACVRKLEKSFDEL